MTQHCRFLFAVVNDAVATKPQAVTWAIEQVGPQWRGLLEQALVDRAHPWDRVRQPTDPALPQPTLEFMALVRQLAGVT